MEQKIQVAIRHQLSGDVITKIIIVFLDFATITTNDLVIAVAAIKISCFIKEPL